MKKPIIIYGAGGLGREVIGMLPFVGGNFIISGFLDDGLQKGSVIDGVEVLGGLDWLANCNSEIFLILAIGNPRVKAKLFRQIHQYPKIKFPILIHSRAYLQDFKRISVGEGSIIGAGSVLTTGITVGKHVLINLNVTVGHDTSIGDFSSVMPGVNLAGNVSLGSEVLIGSGANIINGIKVGHGSIVGTGSVVNHDIPEAALAVGVPARVIKRVDPI